MTVSEAAFRAALTRLAGGVAIVTSRDRAGAPSGLTATSVCSVSLRPPLVMACVDHDSRTHEAIESSSVFALNLLARADERVARRFSLQSGAKFEGLEVSAGVTGAPLLAGALAYCDCSVVQTVPAGDHTIFVGRVEGAGVAEPDEEEPLLYFRGAYTGLEAP